MALKGSAAIPAVDSRRRACRRAGRRPDRRTWSQRVPSPRRSSPRRHSRTPSAPCIVIGGSTNAVIHLLAIAGRLGSTCRCTCSTSSRASTPLLVEPEAVGHVPDGGLLLRRGPAGGPCPGARPAPPRRADRDRPDAGRHARGCHTINADVIRPRRAAAGAVAAARHPTRQPLPRWRGPEAFGGRSIRCSSTRAARSCSTRRRPRMRRSTIRPRHHALTMSWCSRTADRWAAPACPSRVTCRFRPELLRQGVTDMVRICDARMSGTSYGDRRPARRPRVRDRRAARPGADGDRIRLDMRGPAPGPARSGRGAGRASPGVDTQHTGGRARLSRPVPADGDAGRPGLRPGFPRRQVCGGGAGSDARLGVLFAGCIS